jgi:hypothetical protein
MTNDRAVMIFYGGLDKESLTLSKTDRVGTLVKTLTDVRIEIPNSLPVPILEKLNVPCPASI